MVVRQQYNNERQFITGLSQKYLKPAVPSTSQVAAPEPEEDDGGFGLNDVVKGAVGALGTVVDASGKYLARPIAGAASKAQSYIPTNIQNQLEKVDEIINPLGDRLGLGFNPMDEEERKRIKEADSFTEAFNINMEDENWLNQLVFEVGLDPTTYIGAGLFMRAAKVPSIAAKLAQGGSFADKFYAMQNAANLFEEIQALPVTAPLQGLKKGVQKSGKLLGLGDDALELTDRSKLNMAQENFHRAASGVLDRGLNTTETLAARDSLPLVETRGLIERLNSAAMGPTQRGQGNPLTNALRATDDDTLQRAWQQMKPSDPAYTRTKDFLKSRGLVSETTTPGATTLDARIQAQVPSGPLSPQQARAISGFTGTTGQAVRSQTAGILKAQLDNLDLTKVTDRRKAGWLWNQVQTGGLADPGKLVETEFASRGWTTTTPTTTNIAETPNFSIAATNAETRRQARAGLASTANLTDVLSFRANELARNPQYAGLQPADVQARVAAVQNILEPVIGLNPEHFQARELWDVSANKRWIDEALSSTDEMTQRKALRNMLMEMNQTKSAQGVMHPHWFLNKDSWLGKKTGWTGTKRTTNQQRGMVQGRGVNNSVLNPDDLAELEAGGSLAQVQSLQQQYNAMRSEVMDVLNRNSTSGLTRPFDDMTTAQDLTDAATRLASDPATAADAKKITDFLTKFDMTQEAIDRVAGKMGRTRARSVATMDTYRVKDAYLDKLMDTHFTAKARELGVDLTKFDNPSVWSWFPRAWREQALISPRYHFANIMDMTVKSAFNGVNPIKPKGSARDQVSRWGMELDPRIFVGREQQDLQGLFSRQQAPQGPNIYGSGQPNAANALPEFADAADQSALPGVLGKISRWNRRLARASENSFREAAYTQGMRDHLTMIKPRYENEIRQIIPQGQTGQRIIDDLNAMGNTNASNLGIDFSAEDVRKIALHRGATTEQADAIASSWGRQLDEASNSGVQMSNNIHFAMNREYKIEEKLKLRGWMPFHFFATRNLPFYLETLATHPPMLDVIETYYDLSDEERNGLGLGGQSRLAGMMPLPDPLNDLMETVFGPGKIFFNPMVLISFMDQTKNFQRSFEDDPYADEDQSIREKIGSNIERLGSVGLSVAPWINIPLSAAGFYGPDDETMPVLRHSGLIQGLTGGRTSLGEDSFRGLVDEVREVTTQTKRDTKTGSAYKDGQIVNLLAEWSVKNTGKPQSPDYVEASEEGPGNVLWDRAQKEVEKRMFRQNALSMVAPVPMKGTSDVRQAVSQIEQGLGLTPKVKASESGKTFLDALERQGNLATTYRGYDRTFARDIGGSGGSNKGSFDETSWGGDVWGPNAPHPFNNHRLQKAYGVWRGNQPKKADTSVLSFLQYYGID